MTNVMNATQTQPHSSPTAALPASAVSQAVGTFDAEIERIRFTGRLCTVELTDGTELDLAVSEYGEVIEPITEDAAPALWNWCAANQGALMQALYEAGEVL